MWPKMLLELLPHFARLMPMADAYLNSRSERDKTQQAALNTLADEVKSGWTRFDTGQAAVSERLEEQKRQLGQVVTEVAQLRTAMERLDERAARLERTGLRTGRWLLANSVLLTALLIVLVVRSFR
jgi:chromosome segregation ATPase